MTRHERHALTFTERGYLVVCLCGDEFVDRDRETAIALWEAHAATRCVGCGVTITGETNEVGVTRWFDNEGASLCPAQLGGHRP